MRKGLLLILLVLLTVSGAALAQDTPPVFCGDLSEADCALLEQSQTAMMGLTTAAADFNVDVLIEGDGQSIPITLAGSGAFSGFDRMDHELDLGDMTELPDITPMLEALRGFSGDLALTLTVPEDLAEDMPTNSVTLELLLVDGIGYINFEPLKPFMQDSDMELDGWGGLDIASLIEEVYKQITPEMLADFGQSGEMFAVPVDSMAQFEDPAFIEQYISITRTDDGSGATATFETTVDLAGLMKDPAMQDLIREQMVAQAEAQGDDVSDSEAQMALGMMGMVFEDSSIVFTEEIDTSSALLAGANMSMTFDLSNLAEMDDSNSGPAVISVNASVSYTYDDLPAIVAPEDASILPYEMLIGMLIGMNMDQQSS